MDACCERVKEAEESDEDTQQNGLKPVQKEHWWLNPQLIENLPVNIKKGKDSGSNRLHWKVSVIKLNVDFFVSVV